MKRIEYFSATWCGPCKALKPVMNELLVEGYNITFYDVDESLKSLKIVCSQYFKPHTAHNYLRKTIHIIL